MVNLLFTITFSKRYLICFNSKIIYSINRKHGLLNQSNNHNNTKAMTEFRMIKSLIKTQVRKAYSNYISRVESHFKNNRPRLVYE